jgi:hypothetical protein
MPYPALDPMRLRVFPLAERKNLTDVAAESAKAFAADPPDDPAVMAQIERIAEKMKAARARGAAIMITYGAHLIKNGAGALLNALIDAKIVTHLATQGAGIIHDWEFAFQGQSSESVRENAPAGTFGSWDETGRWLNIAALVGAAEGLGWGEAIGRMITEDQIVIPPAEQLRAEVAANPTHPLTGGKADLLRAITEHRLPIGAISVKHPYKTYSVPASAYSHGIAFTVHPGIGYDIIVNHPLYHGGAIGRASGADARIFAASVDRLDGGVYLSIGSAIMSPQVFEKAFSAVNNVRNTEGRAPLMTHHMTIVDLADGGGWDWAHGEPPTTNPAYYLRFCKSFYRMGGTLDYIRCDNRAFLAQLLRCLGLASSVAVLRDVE